MGSWSRRQVGAANANEKTHEEGNRRFQIRRRWNLPGRALGCRGARFGAAALASRFGPEALRALRRIARESEDESIKLRAWSLILERAYGKPAQQQTVETTTESIQVIKRVIVDGRKEPKVIEGGEVEVLDKPE